MISDSMMLNDASVIIKTEWSHSITRVPSRGFFWVLNPHQNHLDPHFFKPWVQWTLCIDPSQAGSNFSFTYLEVPSQLVTRLQQRFPHSMWAVPLPLVGVCRLEWSGPYHYIEGMFGYTTCLVLDRMRRFHKSLANSIHFHKNNHQLRKWNGTET